MEDLVVLVDVLEPDALALDVEDLIDLVDLRVFPLAVVFFTVRVDFLLEVAGLEEALVVLDSLAALLIFLLNSLTVLAGVDCLADLVDLVDFVDLAFLADLADFLDLEAFFVKSVAMSTLTSVSKSISI